MEGPPGHGLFLYATSTSLGDSGAEREAERGTHWGRKLWPLHGYKNPYQR